MQKSQFFDYIIVGNGLAGLQLAIAFAKDSFFKNKKIALIDKSTKSTNDKTWSFWEKGEGKWEDIIKNTWHQSIFYSSKKSKTLRLSPYSYKTIEAIDFYNYAKAIINNTNNITFIVEDVIKITDKNKTIVETKNNLYTSNHVFDSRLPKDFFLKSNNYSNIIQHFKGWTIETATPEFNLQQFTMMDYRLKDGEKTSFTYVLPFSETKALVEFTYFTKEMVANTTYDKYLEKYISEILKIKSYKILATEHGRIPMSVFPFEKYSQKNITKIGTAGGWVKASTGYSFKNSEKKVKKLIENLKNNQSPSKNLINSKYKFYDKIFLKVLYDENEKGEWIFKNFYTKNSIETMFKFLDEDSNFFEEFKIMKSLFSFSFIKAFFKTLFP